MSRECMWWERTEVSRSKLGMNESVSIGFSRDPNINCVPHTLIAVNVDRKQAISKSCGNKETKSYGEFTLMTNFAHPKKREMFSVLCFYSLHCLPSEWGALWRYRICVPFTIEASKKKTGCALAARQNCRRFQKYNFFCSDFFFLPAQAAL